VSLLLLYVLFVFVQTVRHRDYFLPALIEGREEHPARPSIPVTLVSLILLVLALVAVVGLAKKLAPAIEAGVRAASAPPAVVGIVIALLVLSPESAAALRAARRNQLQTSLNLGPGLAFATIGLTILAVAALSVLLGLPLELGLAPTQTALLALTLLLSTITMASGRFTILHGAVHLVVFGAFLVLALVP
jgi:Ca2+:H+ antiporter